MKYYYKIIQEFIPVGTIVDTNECINQRRTKRNRELRSLFEKAYKFSADFELPIENVLTNIIPNFYYLSRNFIKRIKYYIKLLIIKFKMKQLNFIGFIESNYFIDFILEKSRILIQQETKTELPSRYMSSFFFESVNDCNTYYPKFNCEGKIRIVKVEFVETRKLFVFDNNIISDFTNCITSIDFLNRAKLYLNGHISDNPFMEVVFQGKYKIVSYES